MREIKFRAWDKITCELKTVTQIDYVAQEIVFPDIKGTDFTDWKMIDDCILMQYTGLKDKNGKEIYEGDVNQNGDSLVYSDIHARFGWTDGGYLLGINSDYDEIIGNIYENPELI